jgi:CRP/FNR family cyclic AMP-dependent transcriptional regulator
MERVVFAPGQTIIREGEIGDLFYVITQGRVQFSVRNAQGHELTIDEVGPGGFFGELSMLTGEPRAARVQALEEVTTLVLDRDEFFSFLEAHPQAAIDVLRVLGQRLHRSDTLVRQSVSRNVNDLADRQLTLGQRIADTIADISGSMPFLVGNAVWFGGWLLWNQPWFPGADFDPYPYGLLTMIVSLEAIFLSIFVLISQNRQAAKDRLAAEIDHQVNMKAELGVGLLLRRLEDMERSLHYNHAADHRLLRDIADGRTPASPGRVGDAQEG